MSTTREQREMMDSVMVTPEKAERVRITIDDQPQGTKAPYVGNYSLYATSAPAQYDYNAIPVYEQDGVRWVLLEDRDVEFQLGRYASGMYYTVLSVVPVATRLETLLWSRLFEKHFSRL